MEKNITCLKISGAEILPSTLPQLKKWTEHISNSIKIILIYGGGEQITKNYEKHTGKKRPTGVKKTTKHVLSHGVIPAYKEITKTLNKEFPQANFISPEDLSCKFDDFEKKGYVGHPKNIKLDLDHKINIIGFLGTAGSQEVNVNADWIVSQITTQFQNAIKSIIFLTKTGGILNQQKQFD